MFFMRKVDFELVNFLTFNSILVRDKAELLVLIYFMIFIIYQNLQLANMFFYPNYTNISVYDLHSQFRNLNIILISPLKVFWVFQSSNESSNFTLRKCFYI